MIHREGLHAPLINRDNLFSTGGGPLLGRHTHKVIYPPTNVTEKEDHYDLELMIPGFDKQDILISVEEGMLKIKGEHRERLIPDANEYLVQEFDLNSFERVFQLSTFTDENRVEAEYSNGMLKIRLYHKPKDLPIQNVEKIEVK